MGQAPESTPGEKRALAPAVPPACNRPPGTSNQHVSFWAWIEPRTRTLHASGGHRANRVRNGASRTLQGLLHDQEVADGEGVDGGAIKTADGFARVGNQRLAAELPDLGSLSKIAAQSLRPSGAGAGKHVAEPK